MLSNAKEFEVCFGDNVLINSNLFIVGQVSMRASGQMKIFPRARTHSRLHVDVSCYYTMSPVKGGNSKVVIFVKIGDFVHKI